MTPNADWQPTATLAVLQLRARLLAEVRRFFDARGYFEVDTPVLSHERVIDPHLAPFCVEDRGEEVSRRTADPPRLYLQTSPEFAMKRLLAAGARAIYQVGHVFRQGERGRLHNPEFTMIEWYRVGDSHLEQMQTTEELILEMAHAAAGERECQTALATPSPTPGRGRKEARNVGSQLSQAPFARTTYREAFLRYAQIDPMTASNAQLAAVADTRGLSPPASLDARDRDGWLNVLLAELVEPRLGESNPEFLCDYPPTQAALARVRREEFPVAERFELYWQGIELCNGYHELADAAELRQRVAAESARRATENLPPLPAPERLLAAMSAGLPACSGVALGFDRLLMLLVGAQSIDAVVPFTFENA